MPPYLPFALLSLTTLALASNQLPIYFPAINDWADLSVSVSTANPSTTVLVIPCPTSGINDLLANQECGSAGVPYSIISKTIYQATLGPTVVCKHETASERMLCGLEFIPSTTATVTYTKGEFKFVTASITKGAESLTEFQTGGATPTSTNSVTSVSPTSTNSVESTKPTGAASKHSVERSALLVWYR